MNNEKKCNFKPDKKSKAKAAGLKSTFVINDEILMTSFGKGNKAIEEKTIQGNDVKSLQTPEKFDVTIHNNYFTLKSNIIKNASTDNPLKSSKAIGLDQLRIKDKLEKEFFNKNFNDNLHIQLIYNILDIKKIISLYANNSIYALNNLRHKDGVEMDEIGTIPSHVTYKDNNKKNVIDKIIWDIDPYYEYFADVFIEDFEQVKLKNGKLKMEPVFREDKDIYTIFRALSTIRQATFHDLGNTNKKLYTLDTDITPADMELKKFLDTIYNKAINDFNDNFLSKSKKDLVIMFNIFDCKTDEQKKQITQEYYNLVAVKEDKNLGFSIKKLREQIFELDDAKYIKNKEYDSMRQKVTRCIDFLILRYYKENEVKNNAISNFVDMLRASSNEEEKRALYQEQATILWSDIKNDIKEKVMPQMTAQVIKAITKDDAVKKSWLDDVSVKTDCTYFSKLMYLLCLFLDGKEINELLCGLINKFENIQSFIDIIKYKYGSIFFDPNYKFFTKSQTISNELRIIKSFTRMQKEIPPTTDSQYLDASLLLGINPTNDEMKYVKDLMISGTDHNMRNFIINNVIKSSRFRCVVRYNNPRKARKLMSNSVLVKFVLSEIPQSMIDRYYMSVSGETSAIVFEKEVEFLTEKLTNLNFDSFKDVKQKTKNGSAEAIEKERKKAVVGLYLTIIYKITKELVKINALYTIALSCLERDSLEYGFGVVKNKNRSEVNYIELTKHFIDNGYINKKESKYISANMSKFNNDMFRVYRNNIAHLNAVTKACDYIGEIEKIDSYFGLYHFIMQRCLKDYYKNKFPAETKSAFEGIGKHIKYSKDLVKILNIPFAYNLPRYKNLSIKELFYRKKTLEKQIK